jgi:sugar lactone lactonase YvrE
MIRPRSLVVLLVAALACTATTADAATLFTTSYNGNGLVVTYDTTATNPTPTTFASLPQGLFDSLAFDSAGNLYVGDYAFDTVDKFSRTGVYLGAFASFAAGVEPFGLAFDKSGNLYVSILNNNNGTSLIEKFTAAGVGSVFASGGGLSDPDGLAFDKSGNLYVANSSASTIEKFLPGGGGSTFATTLSNPTGLAFDSAGSLYVATSFPGAIEEFSPSAVNLGIFGSTGSTTIPQGLAFDSSGNLYVGNLITPPTSANTIDMFPPSGGVGSLFVTTFNYPYGIAFAPSAVPEPSSLVLGCLALVSLSVYVCARRRLRRCAA